MLSFSIKFFIYECPMSLVTQTASAVMQLPYNIYKVREGKPLMQSPAISE